MVRNLYLILAVAFRAAGLCAVAVGLIQLLFAIALVRTGAWKISLFAVSPTLLGGALLWLLAKPAAKLITSGLDDAPSDPRDPSGRL